MFISNQKLSASEELVLHKGLNLTTTIRCVPYLDMLSPVKNVDLKIAKAQADRLRWKVRKSLQKAKS